MHTQSFLYPLIFALAACATVPPKIALVDPQEERIMQLEEKLAERDKEMEALKARLTHAELFKQAIRPTRKAVPIEKLMPEGSEMESHEANRAGEKIADSSDESLHLYFRGLELMREKKFDAALESFRSFLGQNPAHVYADRAQFLIGESHFLSREYGLTIVATNLLISRYPYSVKVPEAMYQRALSYLEMNQTELGRNALKDVLEKYPTDAIAEAASKRIAQLNVKEVPLIEDANSKSN